MNTATIYVIDDAGRVLAAVEQQLTDDPQAGAALCVMLDGKEVLKKGEVADDAFLGGIKFYVKGVEGTVPGNK